MTVSRPPPRALVSYSHESKGHKEWVRSLASRLRADGIESILDQWATVPGDQLPAFMEAAIRDNDYVLIVCTPRYKERADSRIGGVGYEGDIMTGEVLSGSAPRKFIPLLREGEWKEASPTWCQGKYYVDLRGDPYSEVQYADLLSTLLGTRGAAPPVSSKGVTVVTSGSPSESLPNFPNEDTPVRILGVVADEVTEPRRDGTRGSGLYRVPFSLSHHVTSRWAEIFKKVWDHPPRFTTMHRPGIARASGNRIILDGTTIEEVKQFHRDTLKLSVSETNRIYAEEQETLRKIQSENERMTQLHKDSIRRIAGELDFGDKE